MRVLFIVALSILLAERAFSKQKIKVTTVFGDVNDFAAGSIEKGRRAEERINFSYPGTKWCGPGNTAANDSDIGHSSGTDKCCWMHDHCDHIAAGDTKHGLTNDDIFTILHCECDREFVDCLHNVDDRDANSIGWIYFRARHRCYKEEFPIVSCSEYETGMFVRRCTKYKLDATKSMQWQWFDLPLYKRKNNVRNDMETCNF